MNTNKHYVEVDSSGFVTRGFSDAFEPPKEEDICINEEAGRHFELFEELNPYPWLPNGAPRFICIDAQVRETTEEEQQLYLAELPAASIQETMEQKVARLTEENQRLFTEMATQNQMFSDFMDFYFMQNPEAT